MHNSLATRYARALIEASEEMNLSEKVDMSMRNFSRLFAQSPDLDRVFERLSRFKNAGTPIVNYLIKTLALPEPVKNLLKLLNQRKRMYLLHAIVQTYLAERAEREGRISATVTTIRRLDDAEISDIRKKLKELTGQTVDITWKQDASILGGLLIHIGDRIIDGTLKTRLKRLQDHLIYG